MTEKNLTRAEVLALPENGGTDTVTDPQTGHTEQVPRPVQFLVTLPTGYAYHIDGETWIVGRGLDGVLYRERRGAR